MFIITTINIELIYLQAKNINNRIFLSAACVLDGRPMVCIWECQCPQDDDVVQRISFTTSVAYADDGSEAPDMVSRSANGNKITFDFTPYLYDGTSDSLIIYTNATAYDENGGITVGALAVDPAGYQPIAAGGSSVTPEPGSLALFGTGILGLGGVLRKRFA